METTKENTDRAIVLAPVGRLDFAAATAFQEALEKESVMCRFLHTSHAFHSPMMDPIVEPFASRVKTVKLSPPKSPFVSTVTGTWISPGEATDPMYWGKQLRRPVRFAQGIETLWERPERVLLEVGPRTTSTTLVRQQAKDLVKQVAIYSLSDTAENHGEWSSILNAVGQLWLAGADFDWAAFYEEEKRHRVALPTDPFERKRFWIELTGRQGPNSESEGRLTRIADIHRDLTKDSSQTLHILTGVAQAYDSHIGPRNEVEQKVAAIWKKLLGVDRVGAQDNFFDLGGDSLVAARLIVEIEKVFDKKLSPKSLYQAQTLEQLSELLSGKPSSGEQTWDAGVRYKIIAGNLLANKTQNRWG